MHCPTQERAKNEKQLETKLYWRTSRGVLAIVPATPWVALKAGQLLVGAGKTLLQTEKGQEFKVKMIDHYLTYILQHALRN
jgi:hypothetical protein